MVAGYVLSMPAVTTESYFPWDATKYGLNIREMDDEHQAIIARMNRLRALHDEGQPFTALEQALKDLVEYTKKHFADEEAYMQRIGFPRLRVHQGVHAQLLGRLAEIYQQLRTTRRLPEDVFPFFKMWLTAHISGIDTQYAAHARSSGA